jgi:hypothetical protein
MHSGWGVLVAVSREANSVADSIDVSDSIEIMDRRRIVVVGCSQENR